MAGLINFEDENEVKQFLDNLGVEYSFQCYKEKDPEGTFSCAVRTLTVLKHCTQARHEKCLLALLFVLMACFFRLSEAGRLFGRGEEEL